jgi:hypothetical protein
MQHVSYLQKLVKVSDAETSLSLEALVAEYVPLAPGWWYAMQAERTQKDLASGHGDFHFHLHALWIHKRNCPIVKHTHWGCWGSFLEIICSVYQRFTVAFQHVERPMKPPWCAGFMFGKISFRLIRPVSCIACMLLVPAHNEINMQPHMCKGPLKSLETSSFVLTD